MSKSIVCCNRAVSKARARLLVWPTKGRRATREIKEATPGTKVLQERNQKETETQGD